MASVYDLLARCIDWATGNAKVQLTDRVVPITETQILTNQVIDAGAQYAVSGLTFSVAEEFVVGVRVDAAHTWKVYAVWSSSSGSGALPFGDVTTTIINVTSAIRGISDVLKSKTVRLDLIFENTDTVQHTYNAFIFRVGR